MLRLDIKTSLIQLKSGNVAPIGHEMLAGLDKGWKRTGFCTCLSYLFDTSIRTTFKFKQGNKVIKRVLYIKTGDFLKHYTATQLPIFSCNKQLNKLIAKFQKKQASDASKLVAKAKKCKDPKQATKYYERAASKHHLRSLGEIGERYYAGPKWGVRLDHVKALSYFKEGALLGDVYCQREYAWMHQFGKGCKTNLDIAEVWYQKAADQGDVRASYFLGKILLDEGDEDFAFHYFDYAASKGHVDSNYIVGGMYENDGDLDKAHDHYKAAAGNTNGHTDAQYRLGVIYRFWKNLEDAKKYLQMASAKGHIAANFELGHILFREKKYKEALPFFQVAAKDIHPEGNFYLGHMHRLGLGVPKDLRLAEDYQRSAANLKCPNAYYALGRYFSKTKTEQTRWMLLAAEKGFRPARKWLIENPLYGKNMM